MHGEPWRLREISVPSVCLRGETGRLAAGSLSELQSRAKACYLFLLFAT